MLILFWASLVLILYTYAGYPVILAFRRCLSRRSTRKHATGYPVSVVIAAHNGAEHIERRLRNLLSQDFQGELCEIIVVSDGSTDRTAEIARSCSSDLVVVFEFERNAGKAVAVNQAVSMARGDIIIFADVRQEFRVDAVQKLTDCFADPAVGCVSGELLFLQDAGSAIEAEMGAYWKYEKFIRRSESSSGSVVGATGCIYAIRRELYIPLPAGTILDDVLTPMNIARQGKRVLFEAQAVAYDTVSKDAAQEWRRKVRTLAGNWQLFSLAPWILLPWRNPLWWRFLSHKLLRLVVPFLMPPLLAASLLLPGGGYRSFALLQLAFYAMALTGWLFPRARSLRPVNLSYFFMVLNGAAVAGFWKWATGGCATAWQPAYRAVINK